jgi:membrane-associated phospholipid phosphatase
MLFRNCLLLAILITYNTYAQDDTTNAGELERPLPIAVSDNIPPEHMYHVNNAVDMPIVLALGGTAIYALTIIYSKKNTPESVILNLNKNDVPSYDRWTAGWHDDNLDKISYYPFYGVMPLPLILLADKQIAQDKGRIGLMYLEAFAFEGILYTGSVYFADRFRPDVYDTNLPLSYRTNGNFRNSFFAGHVAVMALTTLFISKVYDDYHPYSNVKWVLYGSSAALTLGMAYLRLAAGKHFTSDILVGMAVGTACGLGVPIIHKNRDYKKQRWSLSPDIFDRGVGFSFNYRL